MGPDPARTAVQLGLYRGDGIGDLAGDGAVHRVLDENTVEYVSKKRKPVVYIINETENGI